MKKIFIAVLAVAAALTACNKAEIQAPVSDASRVVKFTADNFYTFETKAAMESGTVGIWAGAPINANNQTYTISGSNLTGNSILWGIEQAGTTTPSYFFAMYPRVDGASFTHGTGYSYAIRVDSGDNKTADIATAEEFMVAATKAAPGTEATPATVAFSFSHPFAKIVYKVTNNSDDAIRCATIAGVYWNGTIDYVEAEATGAKTVTATKSGEVTDGTEAHNTYLNGGDLVDGKYVFHTITMPSTGLAPVIKVFMWSGATFTFNIDGTLNAEAGKEYTANITISNSHDHGASTVGRTMTASFTATDWTAGAAPTVASGDGYSNTGIDHWGYIKGDLNEALNGWQTDLPMKCIGNDKWEVTVTSEASKNFKPVMKSTSDNSLTWYGQASWDEANQRINISSTAQDNLWIEKAGTYKITVDITNGWCKVESVQ